MHIAYMVYIYSIRHIDIDIDIDMYIDIVGINIDTRLQKAWLWLLQCSPGSVVRCNLIGEALNSAVSSNV